MEEKIIDGITKEYKDKVRKLFEKSGIAFTKEEIEEVDYAGYGLDNIAEEGLNLIVYCNNEK